MYQLNQTKKAREAVSAAAPISIDPITRRVNNCGNGKCEGGSGASHYWGWREYKWLLSLCQPHTEHPPKHPQQPLDRRLAMCATLTWRSGDTGRDPLLLLALFYAVSIWSTKSQSEFFLPSDMSIKFLSLRFSAASRLPVVATRASYLQTCRYQRKQYEVHLCTWFFF